MPRYRHHMPFGAELRDDGVRFRLYAPSAGSVDVAYDVAGSERVVPTARTPDGFHEVLASDAGAGTRYRFVVDGKRVSDPASRSNPEGVKGPSVVVDPLAYEWPATATPVRPWAEHVFYEIHVGTFTPAGTYAGAIAKLDQLVDLGVTALELMPVAEFPGLRNWGYDGVLSYAPSHLYGAPGDLKALVAAAHGVGIAVYLDVVYSHFGPEGNDLWGYAQEFYTHLGTGWGAAFDFESDERETVRAFFIENALYWLEEYRFDGLRLDAVHAIFDSPQRRFLRELAQTVVARVDRPVFLVLENEANESALLEAGYRAQWNDDAHHAARVALTRERDAHYVDYIDDPLALLGRALTAGYVYQGEASLFRGGVPRGTPSESLSLLSFVDFLQNHDQIANRPFGERIGMLAVPEALRALLATLLLAPSIPLLFMGEEWAASSPFHYFCDYGEPLATAVREGRAREQSSFLGRLSAEDIARLPDPTGVESFTQSILNWDERDIEPHRAWLAYYRRLLEVRRTEIVPLLAEPTGRDAAYERLGEYGLQLRYRLLGGRTLVLDANLGHVPAPLPAVEGRKLFEVPDARAWTARWTLR